MTSAELPLWAAWIIVVLAVGGAALSLIGALGLARLQRFYDRVHAPTLGATLGMALILLAGLQTIPEDISEAADVDGANRVTQFFRLTLPLLRPTIAVALVFRTLDAIRVFDVFQVVLAQKQYSMATYNYYTLTNSQELGYASAVGVVMFVIILLFTVAYVRILGVSAE